MIYDLTIYYLRFIYDLSNLQFNNVQCTIDLQFSNLTIYFSPPLEGMGEAIPLEGSGEAVGFFTPPKAPAPSGTLLRDDRC